MSGYFARLLAQAAAPAPAAQPRRAAPVAPLEQFVEIDAPPAPAVREASSPASPRGPAAAQARALASEARPAVSPVPAHAFAHTAATPTSQQAVADAAPAQTAPAAGFTARSGENPRAPLRAAEPARAAAHATLPPVLQPRGGDLMPLPAMQAFAGTPLPVEHAGLVDAPSRPGAADHDREPAVAAPARLQGRETEPARTTTALAQPLGESFLAGAPLRVQSAEPARAEVRIGSIALEVRLPSPPPVPRPPAAAPVPAAAPARFSPRRHYLRWG